MKKIKFNLHTNGVGVANLEDLQEHFNIDDILEHYKSGLLQKWLEVQGLQEELEKINNLSKEDKELISKILDIFEIKYSKEDIKELELSHSYLTNKQNLLETFKKNQNDFNQSLESYFSEFRSILREIEQNPSDKAIIKTNLRRLEDDFWPLTLMNLTTIYQDTFSASPLAMILALYFQKFRTILLGNQIFKTLDLMECESELSVSEAIAKQENLDKIRIILEYFKPIDLEQINFYTLKSLQGKISFLNKKLDFENKATCNIFSENTCSIFTGDTNGYWKDLIPKTKKVLVLRISQGSLICAPVNSNEIPKELDSEAVNGNFLILDGLQFKSNNANYSVTYLEI